ncbi:hypothetical protein BE856_25670 [Salmonella enterica]|nr:hypothetical protein [Salmonella enterica]
MYIGRITGGVKSGTNTRPALFIGATAYSVPHLIGGPSGWYTSGELDTTASIIHAGPEIPYVMVLVDGAHGKVAYYQPATDGVDYTEAAAGSGIYNRVAIGRRLAAVTGMSLADMYSVSRWPGEGSTGHKPDKTDTDYLFVAQVNYVTGYVCEASLQ